MKSQQCVRFSRIAVVFLAVVLMTTGFWMLKQSAPPVVKAQNGLGGPLPNLTPLETTLFNTGDIVFIKLWDARQGFGPVATQLRCNLCHGVPVDGGSSPTLKTLFFGKINNDGSFNPMTEEGGIILQSKTVAKFKPSCVLPGEVVPADATIRARHVPPPLFGLGLINSIAEEDIVAQETAELGTQTAGKINWVLDENAELHAGRFGHKAEAATLLQFVAGALQHDIGITNPINPDEDLPQGNPIPQNCDLNPNPEDDGRETLAVAQYVLYLAPSAPGQGDFQHGQDVFNSVGCALCHLPSYTTGPHVQVRKTWDPASFFFSKALSSQPVNLYSDLLLHDMGTKLQDNIPMGSATGRMFRTAPLWGVSVKLANNIGLLHSGISFTVDDAIRKHSSTGSEANAVIGNYTALSPDDQKALIDFVSSL
jgi:cytochrome c5